MGTYLNDRTLERKVIQGYLDYINIYESIKSKTNQEFKTVKSFYERFNLKHQLFLKFYNRYKLTNNIDSLLPEKRGPKYGTRLPDKFVIDEVLKTRAKTGANKYVIYNLLLPILKEKTPSPSGIYNILKRAGLNKLSQKIQEVKRKIVKEKIGELGHIDCHCLSKGIIKEYNEKLFVVGLIDDASRLMLMDIVPNLKALTVMFATLKMLNIFTMEYQVKFAEIMSDNGKEFGIKTSKTKDNHPFEFMLKTMGIKHRYTQPYRPQTNGKIERFWRTFYDDFIAGSQFSSLEELHDEVAKYNYYYNHQRPHQSLNGKTPFEFAKNCQRLS